MEPSVSDAYLIQRAVEGYLDAYEELVRRHADRAYRVALRLTGDHHDAEDIAQESLVAAWQNLPRFRRDSSFSTWLYRIVTRRALNRIDRARRHHSADLLTEHPDAAPGPAQHLERDLRVDAVTNAVQALPPTQRVVIVLYQYESLSYAQIAEVTNSSESSVRSHLYRARRTLARALEEWR